jgi:hypothetical protein
MTNTDKKKEGKKNRLMDEIIHKIKCLPLRALFKSVCPKNNPPTFFDLLLGITT